MDRVEIGSATWAGLFRFSRSAFRYEGRQEYAVTAEDASRAEFAATGRVSVYPAKQAWLESLSSAAKRGAPVSRVHAIQVPHSSYIQWELASYALNVEAGEDVRLIPVTGEWPEWLPGPDFWLFDDRAVLYLQYDDRGMLTGARVTSQPATVARVCSLRDRLMADSVPYSEYTRQPAGQPAAG